MKTFPIIAWHLTRNWNQKSNLTFKNFIRFETSVQHSTILKCREISNCYVKFLKSQHSICFHHEKVLWIYKIKCKENKTRSLLFIYFNFPQDFTGCECEHLFWKSKKRNVKTIEEVMLIRLISKWSSSQYVLSHNRMLLIIICQLK